MQSNSRPEETTISRSAAASSAAAGPFTATRTRFTSVRKTSTFRVRHSGPAPENVAPYAVCAGAWGRR